MAKLTHSIAFKNAIIDLDNNTITEITKEGEYEHILSDVLNRFKEKQVALTIKEDDELETTDSTEV